MAAATEAQAGQATDTAAGAKSAAGAATSRLGKTGGDADFKAELKATMHSKIKQVIRERTGPSFEERIELAAANFRKQARETEQGQLQIIEAAKQRARLRPCESPVRAKELVPPSFEERGREHARAIRENAARYAKEHAERVHRMKTREPLFKVSEVKAAFEMQRQRQLERRRQLTEEERQRWQHLQELQMKVVERPLVLEDYARPEHSRSVPNVRLIPNHTKETPLQAKIGKSISQTWFTDSAWGKEVSSIRERQDNRPRLHEIPYPPKRFPEKKPFTRIKYPLEEQMEQVINQPWYQNSQWCGAVKDIKQRQDDRPKLHEISYPPKH